MLMWEEIDNTGISKINRAKVVGGWLVTSVMPQPGYAWRESVCFVPDPNHGWKIDREEK